MIRKLIWAGLLILLTTTTTVWAESADETDDEEKEVKEEVSSSEVSESPDMDDESLNIHELEDDTFMDHMK